MCLGKNMKKSRTPNKKWALSLLTAAICAPTYALALPETEALLPELVVSGSRAQTKLAETPQAIGAVKGSTLARDKPKTMGDILNRIPGVHWNDLGNEQHSMGIRQPISTNAAYQYLEDGIPIRPLGVFNHNSLNEINMAGASGVEVVKGAASSLYGSNAVGGAVNFLTAKPSRTPWAQSGIRHDPNSAYTRVDTGISNTWGPLGLRLAHYSSRRSANNWQEYSDGRKDSFTLSGDYALNASSQLRGSLVHTDLNTAMTGSLFESDYRNNPGKSLNTFTYRADRTTRANLAWEGETTSNGLTTVTAFYRKNNHSQLPSYSINSCTATTCQGSINSNRVNSVGLDIKHEQNLNWLDSRLIAGLYLDQSKNAYASNNLEIVRDPQTGRYVSYSLSNATNPKGVRDYEVGIFNSALFAQWELSPLDKTRLVLGGRYDAIQYDFANKLTPAGSANFGAANESRSFSRLSPKVGATYALSQTASTYANISQGFTPPEVSQLYSKTAIPNLKPGIYTNYEIGLRMAFLNGALKLDSAVYRLDGRDTIVSHTISPGNSENRNAGRTRSQGLELGLNYDAAKFDARLATAFTSHRFLQYQASSTLDYSGRKMPQAPSNTSSIELGYKPVPDARIALELLHQGQYWMNNANTVRYPGHNLLNLRASYKFAKGWDYWLQVRNLMGKKYADSATSSFSGMGAYTPNSQNQYTPGAARSVMMGITYTYESE